MLAGQNAQNDYTVKINSARTLILTTQLKKKMLEGNVMTTTLIESLLTFLSLTAFFSCLSPSSNLSLASANDNLNSSHSPSWEESFCKTKKSCECYHICSMSPTHKRACTSKHVHFIMVETS